MRSKRREIQSWFDWLGTTALALLSYTYIAQSEKEEAIDQILMQSLANVHYSPMTMDDAFSEKVYKLYIQRLDYSKKFLLKTDVDELKKYEQKSLSKKYD